MSQLGGTCSGSPQLLGCSCVLLHLESIRTLYSNIINAYFPAGVEEEYQTSAKKREEKENSFNDVRAELSSLIAEVERQQEKLRHLNKREEESKTVISSHPERISRLKEKIDSTLHLLMPETDKVKSMDCSQ